MISEVEAAGGTGGGTEPALPRRGSLGNNQLPPELAWAAANKAIGTR